MVLQVGLQPFLGDFGFVLSGQATKYTVLMRPKDLFCVNFELGGQISLDQWSFRLAFSQPWVILALFWVARPQNPLSCEARDIFCFHFGQEWHLPTQQPGFGSKHSSKGKPGTCALFRNLAISC
jgi:hypothetical protein